MPQQDAATSLKETPIVVFVNKKSGGQKGEKILAEFTDIMAHEHVYSLQDGGPEVGLKYCLEQETIIVNNNPEKARIVVAGGDGTVGWVISGLDKLQIEDKRILPVMHLPLGTGNDMARATGWGGGYDGGHAQEVLDEVRKASPFLLDRWDMTIKGKAGEIAGERMNLRFYNYFSIGADAQVALLFHEMREKSPHLFRNRTINKVWYAKSGVQATFSSTPSLARYVKMTVDGEPMRYANSVRTVIGLNIQSYMAGSDLWGTHRNYAPMCCCLHPVSDFADGSMGDGKIDLVGISGNTKQGLIKNFNCTGVRIEQAEEVVFDSDREMYIQADGEPWKVCGPFVMTISKANPATMLVKA
eukprot:CAMPEP_0198728324 /NCGR_PEP_ID=MMETSP1475-20131203/8319_1 /TAXON_ID= ORGANISM="Unidentified sp., Strain CCMP1999" /NCGR_SAMPLE_ID=MMETSP1475 /ASSEMBLY_ACC=CAM_ASM_001111 /LENGTH=356 /DNA_ID=CAMNT_0044490645 /DNA_START=133 /DNA_END=1203 /DNA_ORIENTATION=-